MSSRKQQVLKQLRSRMRQARSGSVPPDRPETDSHPGVLGEFLEQRIIDQGVLSEWLSDGLGTGAATIVFSIAGEQQRRGRLIVVIDPEREFYPPAAEAMGLHAASLVVVQPRSQADLLWTWEQALRAKRTTVVGPLGKVSVQTFRRLKLAVETGNSLALMLRPLALRGEPSWADLRVAATPVSSQRIGDHSAHSVREDSTGKFSRKVHVEPVYLRGRLDRRSILVDISDETTTLRVDPPLAPPASGSRSARAS